MDKWFKNECYACHLRLNHGLQLVLAGTAELVALSTVVVGMEGGHSADAALLSNVL